MGRKGEARLPRKPARRETGKRPGESYQKLGRTIREMRLQRGLTLKETALKSGLALSFISQVERGAGNPTVASLRAIAKALGVTVGHFFNHAERGGAVVRAHERRRLVDHRGVTHLLLTPRLDGRFAIFHTLHEPRDEVNLELLQHEGEEAVYVLKGKIEIRHQDQRHVLQKGDCLHFSSLEPHCANNIGKGVLECVWVVSPPSF